MKKWIVFFLVVGIGLVSCSKDEGEKAPSNLTVTENTDDGGLMLRWESGSYDDYYIYRSIGEAEVTRYVKPTLYQRYLDKDVKGGLVYNYKVVGINADSVEALSTEVVSITCPDFVEKLDDMEVTQQGRNALIEWKVNFLDEESDVYVRISKIVDNGMRQTVTRIEDVTANGSYVDQYALNPATKYKYEVTLFENCNDWDCIPEELDMLDYTINVDHAYDLTPVDVEASVSNKAAGEIDISWAGASDAEYFVIESKVNDNLWGDTDPIPNSYTSGILTLEGMEDGDALKIRVRGYKGDFSEASDEVEITW